MRKWMRRLVFALPFISPVLLPAEALALNPPVFNDTVNGEAVHMGQGVRGSGAGSFTVEPPCHGATTLKAFLYWDVLEDVPSSTGIGTFNGTPISGVPLGYGPSPCWPQLFNTSYRADVTLLVNPNGLNTFSFPDSGDFTLSPSVEGASLVVVFVHPGLSLKTILIADGNDTLDAFTTSSATRSHPINVCCQNDGMPIRSAWN